MLSVFRPVVHMVGRISSLRHPAFKVLSVMFLMVVVLQYSGILMVTQRYTMSRLYDVMYLVSPERNDANATGSGRRGLLGNGGLASLEDEGKRKGQGQGHIIARYKQKAKATDPKVEDTGEVAHSHMDIIIRQGGKPYTHHNRKGSQIVPTVLTKSDENTDNEEYNTDDKNAGYTQVPSDSHLNKAPTSTKRSVMGSMWDFFKNIRHGLLPSTIATTPKPLVPCPKQPKNLEGPVPVLFSAPDWETLAKSHPEMNPGGHWFPRNCTARHRVALVIPFRDRDAHLRIFLQHMHPFLERQMLDYTIYVVEQTEGTDFNRAMLMNIGFAEAEKIRHHDCFVFHDVDLLPEIAQNMYSCPHLPRHMSAAVDTLGYRLPYQGLFGGVSALRTEHFRLVNGFSNCFFGWGGEDDDMYNRIKHHGLDITRYPLHIARYRMLTHKKEMPSDERFTMLNSGKLRFGTDGISSLVYDLVLSEKRPLYTLIQVRLNKADVIKRSQDLSAQAPEPVDGEVITSYPVSVHNDNDDDDDEDKIPKHSRNSQEQLNNIIQRSNDISAAKERKAKDVKMRWTSAVGRYPHNVAGRLAKLLQAHNAMAKDKEDKEHLEQDTTVLSSSKLTHSVVSPTLTRPAERLSKRRRSRAPSRVYRGRRLGS